MFASILGMLAKAGIGTIATKIADAYESKQKALTDREKIAADERIKTLEARRDVMVAEGGTPVNAIIRALFALPVAAYYGKIFIWDKILGWGTTDSLGDELQWTARVIIGFYFLYEGGMGISRIAKRK